MTGAGSSALHAGPGVGLDPIELPRISGLGLPQIEFGTPVVPRLLWDIPDRNKSFLADPGSRGEHIRQERSYKLNLLEEAMPMSAPILP